MYSHISSIDDCLILQEDLNILSNWCRPWGMRLNNNKCYPCVFTGPVSIYNSLIILYSVSSIKDLCIILTHNFIFQNHNECVVKKLLLVN